MFRRDSQKMLTSFKVPDVKLDHCFVHIILSGKADCLPLQPLQMRPEVQVVALYVVSAPFPT